MGHEPSGSAGVKRRLAEGWEAGCVPPRPGLGWGSSLPGAQGWGSRPWGKSWGSETQKSLGSAVSLPCCWQAMAAATARQSSAARGVLKVKVPSPESLRRPASKEKTDCWGRGEGEGLAPTLGRQQPQQGVGNSPDPGQTCEGRGRAR